MKATYINLYRKSETLTRVELQELVGIIRKGPQEKEIHQLREVYHLMNFQRLEDGQIATDMKGGIRLPRLCFAAEFVTRGAERKMQRYNGLIVLEFNGLKSYEEAVAIRNKVRRMPQTVLCFLGASGKSVKIVCRGELWPKAGEKGGALPTGEQDIRQFHLNLYNTARQAYQAQFGTDIEYMEPRLDRTVYLSSDPEVWYNAEAQPFYADAARQESDEAVEITAESDRLMPARSMPIR